MELSGHEVRDGDEVVVVSVTSRLGFGRLDEAGEGFHDGVVDAGDVPTHDAGEVVENVQAVSLIASMSLMMASAIQPLRKPCASSREVCL